MAKLKAKKMVLEQFKGVAHAEYDFSERTLITGRNAVGKTTIADAYYWLFTDRDYGLTSNPEVHPDNASESEPSVTLVCDIDGKEVAFRKFQKDSRNKKQIEAGAPVSIKNCYEINSVPKSQKDFVSALGEYGIAVDTLLLLSHPEIFTGQKSAECRKILFGMVSEVTDKEIADSMESCEELGTLLENYSIEEISAMKKREQKEAEHNLDAIPEQIIGMEKSKADVDIDGLNNQKASLTEEIAQMESAIEELNRPTSEELTQQLVILEKEERAMKAEANSERLAKLTDLNAKIGDLNMKRRHMESDKERFLSELERSITQKDELENEYERLSHEFQDVKASEFDFSDQVCPTCGQGLPVHAIDKAKTKFEEDKKAKMYDINRRAADIKKKYHPDAVQSISENEKAIKDIDSRMADISKQIDTAMEERAKHETPIEVANSPEHKELLKQIAEIHHALNQRDDVEKKINDIRIQLLDRKQVLKDIEDALAQVKMNEMIDFKIAEAKKLQVSYRQASANVNKILDQIKAVSMEKNRRLTDEVNSHFQLVRFKLFDQQKNGEFKDCCVPTIRNNDGVYRTLGSSANTALEVRGKLDIINGLQKFYGVYLPVWLDGAECLDSENAEQIHMDTQLITLSVSDGDLTVKGA